MCHLQLLHGWHFSIDQGAAVAVHCGSNLSIGFLSLGANNQVQYAKAGLAVNDGNKAALADHCVISSVHVDRHQNMDNLRIYQIMTNLLDQNIKLNCKAYKFINNLSTAKYCKQLLTLG